MTTIIGNKSGIWADKKVITTGIGPSLTTKVIKLPDGTLFGTAGNLIELPYILELYESFIKENPNGLDSLVAITNFVNTVEDNSNIKKKQRNEYIVIGKKYQLIFYQNGQMDLLKDDGYVSIGSGSDIAMNSMVVAKKLNVTLEPEDLFDIVSSIDMYTSKEFDFIPLG